MCLATGSLSCSFHRSMTLHHGSPVFIVHSRYCLAVLWCQKTSPHAGSYIPPEGAACTWSANSWCHWMGIMFQQGKKQKDMLQSKTAIFLTSYKTKLLKCANEVNWSMLCISNTGRILCDIHSEFSIFRGFLMCVCVCVFSGALSLAD